MSTFFSYNALVGQRFSGYKNTTYALAELVDNSFDALAENVTIIFLEKRVENKRRIEEVLILDDGKGMDSSTLQGALQFGNTTNTDMDEVVRTKKKGKFGFGLPNASLSQSPSIHVYSWQRNKQPLYVYLDMDKLKESSSIDIPTVAPADFPAYYKNVMPDIGTNGTLVSWRRCDRLSNTKGETIARNSCSVIGRLYRYLLGSGKKISFKVFLYTDAQRKYVEDGEEMTVVPNDPMFLMENTALAPVLWKAANGQQEAFEKSAPFYKKYSIDNTKCRPTNTKLTDKCFPYSFEWSGKVYTFEIITSCAVLDIQKPGIKAGGSTSVGVYYGRKEHDGNISFVRAEREIAAGHFGFYKPTDARHRWWSIEVNFNADADDLLGLHNNKQGIEFVFTARAMHDGNDEPFDKHTASLLQAREELWTKLSEHIEDARKEAFKQVREQHNRWDTEHIDAGGNTTAQPNVPLGTQFTNNVIKKVDGTRPANLPQTGRTELTQRLIEKYPNISREEIQSAVEALDQGRVRACVLYAPTESQQLWSYCKVFDFLVVMINTKHEFYLRVLSELRHKQQEGALTSMELFISSLAVEEDKFITRDEAKEAIEEFRTLVGVHLHNYIKHLPESVSIGPSTRTAEEEEG